VEPVRTANDEPSDAAQLLLTFATFALTFAALFLVEHLQPPQAYLFRYLGILPVVIVGFFYGSLPALAAASLVSLKSYIDLVEIVARSGFTPGALQHLLYLAFIHLLAYAFADLSASIRAQFHLKAALQGQEALLDRSTDPQKVIEFLVQQARLSTGAEAAVFLLHDTLNAQWKVIAERETTSVRLSTEPEEAHNGGQPLVSWLLRQQEPVLLNQLDHPDRWLLQPVNAPRRLRSLVAVPLRSGEQPSYGWLVAVNRIDGRFQRRDLERLKELLASGQKALQQAESFARTDRALAGRVAQLAAIQRTARELNATLNYSHILDQTAACALEIARAHAGLVALLDGDFPLLYRGLGMQVENDILEEALRVSSLLLRAKAPLEERIIPYLRPTTRSRLFTPIVREQTPVGFILVERSSPQAFDAEMRDVLSILSDHAATALENTRLFQQVQREKQRTSLIIHSIADGLITTGVEGRILLMNPAAEALTGWRLEECLGLPLSRVLQLNDGSGPQEGSLQRVLRDRRAFHRPRQVIHTRSGARRVISLSMAPLLGPGEDVEGAAVLFHDITSQDEQDRLQREMVASLSHELRSPLGNIRMIAEMLLEEGAQSYTPEQRQSLELLLGQSQHLASFVDRMLDVHRIDTGRLNLQRMPLAIGPVIEEAVHAWRFNAAGVNIRLQIPERAPWVWGDEAAIQSVLFNLLENAARYAPDSPEIVVRVAGVPEGQALVSVEDYGPGVPYEHQSKIFDRFYRVDGSDAQTVYGHGLGLYICRSLVRAMGGDIYLQSTPGKGSRFTFTLPCKEA